MSRSHRVFEWFREIGEEIQADWERLHQQAESDPQRAGHGGEATWADHLGKWLPPQYDVATRKYILFEVEGAPEPRETDVVIYSPGYPRKLRGREEVLAGGVAAAFNVRLTLNADGVRDGVERAAEMRRHLKPRYETVRGELLGAYPVGLLAHSHDWKGESPRDTMTDALRQRDQELAQHPRECLDFACVASLGAWVATASTWLDMGDGPMVMTSMQAAHPELSAAPVGVFLTHLLRRLALADPTIQPMADGLQALETLAFGGGVGRQWKPADVFSEELLRHLPHRLDQRSTDWRALYV